MARETRTSYFILFISWYWCHAAKTPFPLVSYVTARDDSTAVEATIAHLSRWYYARRKKHFERFVGSLERHGSMSR